MADGEPYHPEDDEIKEMIRDGTLTVEQAQEHFLYNVKKRPL
jgi:hypothetical protein